MEYPYENWKTSLKKGQSKITEKNTEYLDPSVKEKKKHSWEVFKKIDEGNPHLNHLLPQPGDSCTNLTTIQVTKFQWNYLRTLLNNGIN